MQHPVRQSSWHVCNSLFRRRKNLRQYINISFKSQSHKQLGTCTSSIRIFKILYIKILRSILKYSCYLVSWQSTNSVLSACCKLKRNRYFLTSISFKYTKVGQYIFVIDTCNIYRTRTIPKTTNSYIIVVIDSQMLMNLLKRFIHLQ